MKYIINLFSFYKFRVGYINIEGGSDSPSAQLLWLVQAG